jgi:hypothetical protein
MKYVLQPRLDYHYLQPFLIWMGATGVFFFFPSQATDNYLFICIQYNFWPTYCEGVGTWASYGSNDNKPWGGRIDFAVPQIWYRRIPAVLTATSTFKRAKGGKKVLAACPSWAV